MIITGQSPERLACPEQPACLLAMILSGLKILRNASTLLRVVRRVLYACVTSCRVVANNGLPWKLLSSLVIRVRVLAVLLVVVRTTTAIRNANAI